MPQPANSANAFQRKLLRKLRNQRNELFSLGLPSSTAQLRILCVQNFKAWPVVRGDILPARSTRICLRRIARENSVLEAADTHISVHGYSDLLCIADFAGSRAQNPIAHRRTIFPGTALALHRTTSRWTRARRYWCARTAGIILFWIRGWWRMAIECSGA